MEKAIRDFTKLTKFNLEIELKSKNISYDSVEESITDLLNSTDSLKSLYDKRHLHLGQMPGGANPPPKVIKQSDYDYFVTICFPNRNFKFNTYKTDYFKKKDILGNWEWSELSQDNQYKFINFKFRNNLQDFNKLDLFFEQTKANELHIHFRCTFNSIHNMKEIKNYFHQMFNIPIKYNRFIDIKIYQPDKWNDYQVKTKKEYQILNYKNIKK